MLKSRYHPFTSLRDVSAPASSDIVFELSLGKLQVGTLRRENNEWIFRYTDSFARQSSVAPIVDFPIIDREYRSKELWPFFTLRIPSITQSNVQAFLRRTGKTKADVTDLMREFGHRSIANPFVLKTA